MAPAATLTAVAVATPRKTNHPTGPWLFDTAVRDLVRPTDLLARLHLRDVSDVTLSLGLAWPLLVDTLLVAGWAHGSPDVALQLAVLDVEAIAFAGALQVATSGWVARERPYGTLCAPGGTLDPETRDCRLDFNRYRSFFSGHATAAFASAGLVCVNHAFVPLYGEGRAPAVAACAGAVTLALATATLRVSGDQHWPTDIATGAVVGLSVGVALPLLTRYLVPSYKAPVDLYADGAGAGIRGRF
jgi:membrane-associated phospholipid phosphatase